MIDEILIKVIEKNINEKIISIKQVNSGYSRIVFVINDRYILKIVTNPIKDSETIKEVKFLLNNNLEFIPKVIFSDFTKKSFPYVYYLERKINGESLLLKWPLLNENEKQQILIQLLKNLEKLHSLEYNPYFDTNYLDLLIKEYDNYLNRIIESNILNKEKIHYLHELKTIIPNLLEGAKTGLIHGDLHFNNILINDNNEISIIDFEKIKRSFIERELDPINRMSRNPNSFNTNSEIILIDYDFRNIMNFIKNNFEEINNDKFDDRLLFFDCLNSLMWLDKYPKYELYNDILFSKSRKLLR
jgi:hypothetical protein